MLAVLWLGCSGAPPGPADAAGELDASVGSDAGAMEDAGTGDGGAATPTLTFRRADGGEVTTAFFRDVVTVHASGLEPGAPVTLQATMPPWSSTVTFTVATDGTVDTGRDAPVSGSYRDVDPDGPFWSMNTARFALAQSPDVEFRVTQRDQLVAQRILSRTFEIEGLRVVRPTNAPFVGTLYLPPGPGPVPAFLAFGGSEGGLSGGENYVDQLVPRGVAVLAVAYFGAPGLPSALKNVPLEYFDGALDWLRAHPEVDANRLGVIGGSRGGELALLLAVRQPRLRAVVADAPSGYVWGPTERPGFAWTSADAGVPYLPSSGATPRLVSTPFGAAYAFRSTFTQSVSQATPADLEAARVRVEASQAAIALFAGQDDQVWPACPFAEVAWEALVRSGHTSVRGDVFECFAEAGHSLDLVGYPTTWSSVLPLSRSELLLAGGTPRGIANAGRRRLSLLHAFVSRTMAP
jgi:dienelactone hydrolase